MSRIERSGRTTSVSADCPGTATSPGQQRVWLAVYDKEDERKLRLRLGLFEEATQPPATNGRLRPDRCVRRLDMRP